MAGISERVYSLIKETVEDCGVGLWDVKYLKEGASRYLRVFIESEEGISIDDCTRVSHAIDPVIDAADPIDESYYLEVCSPGINRELSRKEHFSYALGKNVSLKFYKAVDGQKEINGILKEYGDTVTLLDDSGAELKFLKEQISKMSIFDRNI